MDKKRCFIGIKIPEWYEYQQRLRRLSHDLDVKISITNPERYHLTLHFFGDIDSVEQEKATDILNSVEKEPLDLSFTDPGSFPQDRPKKTKVLFIHPNQGRDKIIDFTMNIRSALNQGGFKVERRTYHPHLTVARVRHGRDIGLLQERWMEQQFEEKQLHIDHFSLIHSDLSNRSVRYQDLETFNLD